MRSRALQLCLSVSALALLGATPAWAQYQAKINDIRVLPDGATEVYATVLDPYGLPPQIAEFERITVNFGQANEFSGDDLQFQLFKDSGQGTDYVVILPAYEGFGINNAVAAAQGAGVFQATHVGETDSIMFFTYGDGVLPFEGEAAELAASYREPDGVARVARPYMLSALDEACRYFEDLAPNRRRIIILVGTGLDVRLGDASQVELPPGATPGDYDNARREVIQEHETILRRYIEALDQVNARVYAIGYNDFRVDYLEVLKALSRKSGGTFRRVTNIGDLAATGGGTGVFNWIGEELDAELILRPAFSVESERQYEIWATFRFPDPETQQILEEIRTRPFILDVPRLETGKWDIIPYLIAIGVILIVAFLLVVVLFFMSKRLKKERSSLAERKKLEEKVALGKTFCPTCYRKMQPDWQQCLFCASGMPPLAEKPKEMLDADEAKKKLEELDGKPAAPDLVVGTVAAVAFYATKEGKPTCKTCGRVVDPAWKECMFCAAGLPPLPEMAPAPVPAGPIAAPVAGKGLAPMAAPAAAPGKPAGAAAQSGGEVKTVALQVGVGTCPKCNRPVPPDWKECLYCKAGV